MAQQRKVDCMSFYKKYHLQTQQNALKENLQAFPSQFTYGESIYRG